MSGSLNYALWLLPPDDVRARFAQLIREIAATNDTPEFDPHITLLEAIDGDEGPLRAGIRELAFNTQPIEVRLTEANYLDEFHRALFIMVEPAAAVLAARAEAQARFATENDRPYMPHMSLLYGNLAVPTKESLLDRIGHRFDMAFRVSQLLLVAVAGPQPSHWRYVERFPLGNAAS